MKSKTSASVRDISYVVILLAAIILLFFRFSLQTSSRIETQNKDYAADSARLKSVQIDQELSNALSQINTYAYFVGESLTEPVVTAQMLAQMEENSYFDAVIYTDKDGMDYASDGRTHDVTQRLFYTDGIQGNSGIPQV